MFPTLLLPILLTAAAFADPAHAFHFKDWVLNEQYTETESIQQQIQCYALPYGLWGLVGHLLTYYTVFALSQRLRPGWPYRRLRARTPLLNYIFQLVCGVVTLTMSVFTLIRCRNTWPFILIAVWKMVLSATIASIAWHANYLAVKERRPSQLEPPFAAVANAATHLSLLNVSPLGDSPDFSASLGLPRKKFRSLLWWTAFYFLGAIVGLVGILAIVFETMENSRVRIITYVFGCVVGLGVVVAVSYIMSGRSDLGPGGFGSRVGWSLAAAIGVAIFEMLFLIAFYTDWVLAALAGDMLGVHLPTANLASALIYFFAKRAPMLSR